MERLTPIPDWPGYAITPSGQVWSFKRKKWLSIFPWKKYYYGVKLCHQGKSQNQLVHTLVGRTFLPYIPGAMILHRDESLPAEEINHVSNLFIGNGRDNIKDAQAKGRLRAADNPKPRRQIGPRCRWFNTEEGRQRSRERAHKVRFWEHRWKEWACTLTHLYDWTYLRHSYPSLDSELRKI